MRSSSSPCLLPDAIENHLHGGVGVLEDSYVILLESCRSVMLRSIVTEDFVPTQILPGIG